jgi:hypothetical protein
MWPLADQVPKPNQPDPEKSRHAFTAPAPPAHRPAYQPNAPIQHYFWRATARFRAHPHRRSVAPQPSATLPHP